MDRRSSWLRALQSLSLDRTLLFFCVEISPSFLAPGGHKPAIGLCCINCLGRAYAVVVSCVFPLKTFFVSLLLPPFLIISRFDHFVMYLDTVHSILLSI